MTMYGLTIIFTIIMILALLAEAIWNRRKKR